MKERQTEISFPALKITQPIGDFFVGAIKWSDLVEVSYTDVRELHKNEIDTYIGIQRRLSTQRSKELKEYVNSFDATFPTSVILAVNEENASWDENSRILTLKASAEVPLESVAKIIDGQHRVDGLTNFKRNSFDVNVSIFIGADLATQANIFATVNLAQTKVNRSLAYDLLSYEKLRSPQKTAHHIAVALDQMDFSPLYQRVKRLGNATPGRWGETITQAAIVESLLDLMSHDPMSDRNSFFGKFKISEPTKEEHERYPFRHLFLKNRDADITQIVINFLSAVRDRWPESWAALDRKGNVLPKTNGLKALMRYLKLLFLDIAKEHRDYVPTKEKFKKYLDLVELNDPDFNTDTFKPGTSGEAKLFSILKESLNTEQG